MDHDPLDIALHFGIFTGTPDKISDLGRVQEGVRMYTREEREGILWGFHRSGLSVSRACGELSMFPYRNILADWLRMDAAVFFH